MAFDGMPYGKPAPWAVQPALSAAPGLWRNAGLVLPFWDGGTQRDLSPHRRAVTTIGAPALTTTARGPALDFNGTSDGLSVPMDFTSDIITVTALLRWDNNGSNRLLSELSSNFNSNNDSFLVNAGASAGTVLSAAIQSGTVPPQHRSETVSQFTVGAIHAFTLTLDNSTTAGDVRIWRDGVELCPTIAINNKDQSGVFRTDTLYLMHRGAASLWADGALMFFAVHDRQLSAVEIDALHADPFVMLRERVDIAPILLGGSLSTSATLTPGVGAVTVVGAAPTVSASAALTPGAGVITVAGEAVAVAASALLLPAAGAITVAGQAATVSTGSDVTLTPGAGSITVAGAAPTVSASASLASGAGSITVTGFAPSVSTGGSARRVAAIAASQNAAALGGSQNAAALGGSSNQVE